MYKYPVKKVSIDKLRSMCPNIEIELESKSKNKDYAKIQERLVKSKSGYVYVSLSESKLLSSICNKNLNEDYKSDVNEFYNDFKSVLIDEGPQASLMLSLVYDDLYKRDIKLDIVQRYANIDYDIYQMMLARKALMSGLDDIEIDFILGTKLSQDQQNEIINALRTDVPYLTIKSWIKNNYTAPQIELATRCYVMDVSKQDTGYLISLNLDDEMTQYVKQALQYGIPVPTIKKYLEEMSLIDFKRAIRDAKRLHNMKK